MRKKAKSRSKVGTFLILGMCGAVLFGGAFILYFLKGAKRITTSDFCNLLL